MRIGFVGGSYTSRSGAIADEECINLFAETLESQGGQTASKSYGGDSAQALRSYYGTPGTLNNLKPYTRPGFPDVEHPVRGTLAIQVSTYLVGNPQAFAVVGQAFGALTSTLVGDPIPYQLSVYGFVANDGKPVSMACNGVQILIVSAGHAYCFDLNIALTFTEVTSSLVGTPIDVDEADGYFIVTFADANKFQVSDILDGTTWPGLQVNAVNVFPENITSIIVNHRELLVFGSQHMQPYQNTGSDNVYDVIGGTLIEKGCVATFAPCRVDNTVFFVDEDERGGRSAWRLQGYTPTRISTYAVEVDLASAVTADIAAMVTYSYQDAGHLFWVLYVPNSRWSWVYDVTEQLWHKRASWDGAIWSPHHSWNHMYAFGKHLVGDWASGNLYELSFSYLDDDGTEIRRLRRAPTISNEMERIFHVQLTVDFETGLPSTLTDGSGNPRPPQATLRWSDNRGKTWSSDHIGTCGLPGEYTTRVIFRRLGTSRYRVYEMSMTDRYPWRMIDAYLVVS